MTLNRRGFFAAGATVAAGLVAAPAVASADVSIQANQSQWRFCEKCYGMFYNGRSWSGACPAGGGHRAQGFNFNLFHSMGGESDHFQGDWCYCESCAGMYYAAHVAPPLNTGLCPGESYYHAWQGWEFFLHHDVPVWQNYQGNWRHCDKCWGLFYYGYPTNGRCPAGGQHRAQGWTFVLPYL
jgi:hypothetical protein